MNTNYQFFEKKILGGVYWKSGEMQYECTRRGGKTGRSDAVLSPPTCRSTPVYESEVLLRYDCIEIKQCTITTAEGLTLRGVVIS